VSDLRARILSRTKQKGPADTLDVPEWGEKVGVRRLSLRERLAFERENGPFDALDRKQDPDGYSRWLVRYCIATATDLQGERLFAPEDEKTLDDESATSIERVVLKALKVNVVTAEEVRELGNSSGEVRNGASPSDSAVTTG
jgi:hypothetical protein